MALKDASDVARRCLCLELLLQRLGLEIDEDDPVAARDEIRNAWLSRIGDLSLDGVILPDERAYLERPVGSLSEDETDDIEARVITAMVLLWALSRLPEAPSAAMLGDAVTLMAEHGLLGDGSISAANATVAAVQLRPESELRDASDAYARTTKGDAAPAGSAESPEEMVAKLAGQALSWVLDRDMKAGEAAAATASSPAS